MTFRQHLFINNTFGGALILQRFPCADCGASIKPDVKQNQIYERPVLHSIQGGKCHECGAVYLVFNARTVPECVALEPLLDEIAKRFKQEDLSNQH